MKNSSTICFFGCHLGIVAYEKQLFLLHIFILICPDEVLTMVYIVMNIALFESINNSKKQVFSCWKKRKLFCIVHLPSDLLLSHSCNSLLRPHFVWSTVTIGVCNTCRNYLKTDTWYTDSAVCVNCFYRKLK